MDRISEAGRYGARSIQRGADKLDDLKQQGIRYATRQPLQAVAIAAAGVIVGVTSGLIVSRVFGAPDMVS